MQVENLIPSDNGPRKDCRISSSIGSLTLT